MIIILEGPDNSGKTTIAKELSRRSGISYYKFPKQNEAVQQLETANITRYASTFFADFIQQVPVNVIMDRHYPTEMVYAKALGRPYDYEIIRYLDNQFAKANACIVICMKKSYEGFHDDLIPDEYINSIIAEYQSFCDWSIVKNILFLDTTSENLQEQMMIIGQFLKERYWYGAK